jgi:hypothetical protein
MFDTHGDKQSNTESFNDLFVNDKVYAHDFIPLAVRRQQKFSKQRNFVNRANIRTNT